MSERPAATVPSSGETAGVIAPPPLIFLAGLGLGFALEALLPSADVPTAVSLVVGIPLLAVGIALQSSFIVAFRRRRTPIRPDRPTATIVTTGPYRFTRNPAYLGMTSIYAGIAVCSGALWPLATLIPTLIVVDRFVIAREERYLERRFGAEYTTFKARVRRWL